VSSEHGGSVSRTRERGTRRRPRERVRLLIVDEQPLLSAGVRTLLEASASVEVVGEAQTIDEAVSACRAARPDVVLVDLDEASSQAIDWIRRLRRELPHGALVVVARRDDDEELYREVAAGAAGHVSGSAAPDELVDTVLAAAGGDEPIRRTLAHRPAAARRVLESFAHLAARMPAVIHREGRLSERELAILSHAARGMTNLQIGHELGVSEHTVKSAISHILGRFGLRHRTEAVVLALRLGWISPPGPSGPT
jgi:DNA-binding NarL/FixJ family response regulator